MICYKCKKDLKKQFRTLACDRPYLNILFHKECFPLDIEEKNNIIRNYISDNNKFKDVKRGF